MAINSTYLKRDLFSQYKLEQWAENMIKVWVAKMEALGMFREGNSGRLARSFFYTVIWEARGSDRIEYLQRIKFAFNYYGKFVDFGLGRGTDIKDRFKGGRDPNSNPRKRKKWMREPWFAEMKKLRPIITAHMKAQTRIMLKQNFENVTDTFFRTKRI